MRTTIEFEATASHDYVHGSSSAEINERTNLLRTTVEFEATASHDYVHGSSSAEINEMTNMLLAAFCSTLAQFIHPCQLTAVCSGHSAIALELGTAILSN